jgi:hypothetical protein
MQESPLDTPPQFKDSTGNGYDFTENSMIEGNVVTTNPLTPGGTSISFENSGDRLELSGISPAITLDNTSTDSICLWLYRYDLPSYRVMFSAIGADPTVHFEFEAFNEGGIEWTFRQSGFGADEGTGFVSALNIWEKWEIIFNAGTVQMYRNGVFARSFTLGGTDTIDIVGLALGAEYGSNFTRVDGQMSFCGWDARARSADLIFTEYSYWENAALVPVVGTPEQTAVPRNLTLANVRIGSIARLYELNEIGGSIQSTFDSISSTTENDTLSFNVTTTVTARLVLLHPNANLVYIDLTLNTDEGQQVPAGALQSEDRAYDSSQTDLQKDVDILYNTSAKTIELNTSDRPSFVRIYSSIKDHWINNESLTQLPFPFDPYFNEKFLLVKGWDFKDSNTIGQITRGGHALVLTAPTDLDVPVYGEGLGGGSGGEGTVDYIEDRYVSVNIIGGATINQEEPYYQLESSTPVSFTHLNESIQFQDGGTFNYSNLTIFSRPQGRTFSQSSLADIGQDLDFKLLTFSIPVSSVDSQIKANDTAVENDAPYTGMSITEETAVGFTTWGSGEVYPANAVVKSSTDNRWYKTVAGGTSSGDDTDLAGGSDTGVTWVSYTGERLIGSTYYPFVWFIDRNGGSFSQAYTYIQYRLRQGAALGSFTRGDTAPLMCDYQGNDLYLKEGVFIESFSLAFGLDSTTSINFIASDQSTASYLPEVSFTFTNIPNGAEGRIKQGSKTLLYEANITSGSFVYSYTFQPNETISYIFVAPGFNIIQGSRLLSTSSQVIQLDFQPDPSYIN